MIILSLHLSLIHVADNIFQKWPHNLSRPLRSSMTMTPLLKRESDIFHLFEFGQAFVTIEYGRSNAVIFRLGHKKHRASIRAGLLVTHSFGAQVTKSSYSKDTMPERRQGQKGMPKKPQLFSHHLFEVHQT